MTSSIQHGSKVFFGSLIASMALLMGFSSAFSGSGSGTSGNPYQITSCAQFMEINDALSANYVLLNDIDCTEDGSDVMVAGSGFTGTFNGSGHSVTVDIDSPETNLVALFRRVDYGGLIENTHVIGSVVGAKHEVAGIIGVLNGGTLSGSSANVTISLVAPDDYYLSVGGLVGMLAYGSIFNSSAEVNINALSGAGVGGLVGTAYEESTISGCYTSGTVSGDMGVGGLVGFTEDGLTISNCYSTVTVSGNTSVGGLVGYADSSTTIIGSSFAAGAINGDGAVGGLIGTGTSTMIAGGSFRDILDENNPLTDAASGSSGLNTATLQNIQTYLDAGWDISPSGTNLNNGYPFLAREVGGSNSTWYIYTTDVLGCMDEDADNYDEDATRDDGSCEYTEEVVTPPNSGGGGSGGAGSYGNSRQASMTFAQRVVSNLSTKWNALSHTQIQANIRAVIAMYNQVKHRPNLHDDVKAVYEDIITELLKKYPIGQ